jgi:hypothetical protein
MVSVFTSSTVGRGLEFLLGQNKDYEICVCCFSAKHVELWS